MQDMLLRNQEPPLSQVPTRLEGRGGGRAAGDTPGEETREGLKEAQCFWEQTQCASTLQLNIH